MFDLGLNPSEAETQDFLDIMSGNKIYEEHYPWGIYVREIIVNW